MLDFTEGLMTNHFDLLKKELPTIQSVSSSGGVNGFFGQEVLRFHSIAGTLLENFKTDKNASVDERYITNKVRLCERSEPQSNRLLDKPGGSRKTDFIIRKYLFGFCWLNE